MDSSHFKFKLYSKCAKSHTWWKNGGWNCRDLNSRWRRVLEGSLSAALKKKKKERVWNRLPKRALTWSCSTRPELTLEAINRFYPCLEMGEMTTRQSGVCACRPAWITCECVCFHVCAVREHEAVYPNPAEITAASLRRNVGGIKHISVPLLSAVCRRQILYLIYSARQLDSLFVETDTLARCFLKQQNTIHSQNLWKSTLHGQNMKQELKLHFLFWKHASASLSNQLSHR